MNEEEKKPKIIQFPNKITPAPTSEQQERATQERQVEIHKDVDLVLGMFELSDKGWIIKENYNNQKQFIEHLSPEEIDEFFSPESNLSDRQLIENMVEMYAVYIEKNNYYKVASRESVERHFRFLLNGRVEAIRKKLIKKTIPFKERKKDE